MTLIVGIDLGTQGVRALATDLEGHVAAQAVSSFPAAATRASIDGCFEQSTDVWHKTLWLTLSQLTASLGARKEQIAALSVCSTSGTLCLVDACGEALRPAIMYSDGRARTQADLAARAWLPQKDRVGYAISSSFALPRLLWVREHEPLIYKQVRWAVSPADLVIGWLTGVWGVSDWTNMLKMGYDTCSLEWPDAAFAALDVSTEILPRVQGPGAPVARIRRSVAEEIGLPTSARVVSGATDGTAAQLASGAAAPGEWNTTIGTTLVLKGVSERLIVDPLGRVYCHRHPDGVWLPGGASSTGADCLAQRFEADDLPSLDAQALEQSPTPLTIYPLARRGERFPFVAPQAVGFEIGRARSEVERYAAHLEGIACVERLAYETVEELGACVGSVIYTTGGGTRGPSFSQIRADLTNRRMRIAAVPEAALGAAILAASAETDASVTATTARMVRIATEIAPRPHMQARYDALYARFKAACHQRGFLS